ncbi:hypothetical protein TNCV_1115281 [Trichonephila clavipes]|nr:hypothetical protein TNCV_1115281 [Trichonephila clavipes]
MKRYTNAELADIHFINGLANENGRVAVQLYGQHAMNMKRYTNAELADIHFINGLANENGRVAVQLYGEKIYNEAATVSSNVRSVASETGGTWIFQSHD